MNKKKEFNHDDGSKSKVNLIYTLNIEWQDVQRWLNFAVEEITKPIESIEIRFLVNKLLLRIVFNIWFDVDDDEGALGIRWQANMIN